MQMCVAWMLLTDAQQRVSIHMYCSTTLQICINVDINFTQNLRWKKGSVRHSTDMLTGRGTSQNLKTQTQSLPQCLSASHMGPHDPGRDADPTLVALFTLFMSFHNLCLYTHARCFRINQHKHQCTEYSLQSPSSDTTLADGHDVSVRKPFSMHL